MKDDAKGEVHLYQFFSHCLKLFINKMVLVNKLLNSDTPELRAKLTENIHRILAEGAECLNKFEELSESCFQMQAIFSRFVLRVRQSVHNFHLKTSTPEILNFLNFLDCLIKEFGQNQNMKTFLKIILLKTPKKVHHSILNSYQQFQHLQIMPSSLEDRSPPKPKENLFDSYDRYLDALNREYRLFDCLNIQQAFYRRTFFSALEDQNRKQRNLYNEALDRNRSVKEALETYQKQFQEKQNKKQEKQSRFLKSQIQIGLVEMKKKASLKTGTLCKKKSVANEMLQFNISKRVKTDHSTKQQYRESEPICDSQPYFMNSKISLNVNSKQSILTPSRLKCLPTSLKGELFPNKPENDKYQSRNTNFIALKKVQFQGAKLELGPEQADKSSNEWTDTRRRNISNRTNEQIRKKISFAGYSKVKRNIGRESSQDIDLSNLRINICRNEF